MAYLHKSFNGGPANLVHVELNLQANVILLDDANYSRYRSGGRFEYFGGLAQSTPFRINPPYHGHWHVVVDNPNSRSLRASIDIL